ncbi:MAG TPA: type II toxin-antitoxin system RelE/ParE family toxin [Rhizomicrobium sp.]
MSAIYSAASMMDLLEIGEWIAQGSNVRSEIFVRELREACDSLAHMPRAFPLLHDATNIRRKPYKSYLIFYVVSGDGWRSCASFTPRATTRISSFPNARPPPA